MTINIAICDDEKVMCDILSDKIHSYMKSKNLDFNISLFNSGNMLLKSDVEYDILFLDIQLGDMNGIKLAKTIREHNNKCIIIFVTVLSEYVYDAFDVEASDYILKPIEDEKFTNTLNRVINKITNDIQNVLIIQRGNCCQVIRFNEILYCEVINRKIFVHTNKDVIDYYNKIEKLENQLNSDFYRCHRSYIVNLKYVSSYKDDMAHMTNGEQIPVSRSKSKEFVSSILNYMKGN